MSINKVTTVTVKCYLLYCAFYNIDAKSEQICVLYTCNSMYSMYNVIKASLPGHLKGIVHVLPYSPTK